MNHGLKVFFKAILAFAWASAAAAQVSVYTAGDPAAATTVSRGKALCATDPANMAVSDGTSFSTYSVSEFAATGYELRVSIPKPMGRDTPVADAGRWGFTLVNPTRTSFTVTALEIRDSNNLGLVGDASGVQPSTGWTFSTTRVSWAGSVDVPALSTYGFVVKIGGRSVAATDAPLTITATTSVGILTRMDRTTTERSNNSCPFVSLPFLVGGLELFTGNSSNGGSVESGASQTHTVNVVESEERNSTPIPSGTTLTITIPPGWSGLDAATQTGFDTPAITQPGECNSGSIQVHTTTSILLATRPFQFTAVAPANQGGSGLYMLEARLVNASATPPIDTRTEFVAEVIRPATTGTRAGLTGVGIHLSVPNPMGSNKFSTWGVAVSNAVSTPYTVTSVQINMLAGDQFFKAVTPLRPTTGWSRISASLIQWTGSITIPPYEASNFMLQIQANGKAGVDRTVRVTVNNTLSKDGQTTQTTNNPPAASLFYLASGQPVVYTYGVQSSSARNYSVVIKESQGININTGAELKIVVPARWTGVDAPLNQTGFTNRTIVKPTPSSPGEVKTTTSSAIKNTSRTFTFSATAPPDLLDSLFEFPATLNSSQVRSKCNMVARVFDASGGLSVEHVSPAVAELLINQVDLQADLMATPDTGATESIFNFATGAWEPLGSATLTAAPTTLLDTIQTDLTQYFDSALDDPAKRLKIRFTTAETDNHRLDEDYVAFVVSEYRGIPMSVAPSITFRGAGSVAMEQIEFETDAGTVELYTLKVTLRGSDPVNDIDLVRLYGDLDCDGAIDPGETELVSALSPEPDGTVAFGQAGVPMLTFTAGSPACAIIAFDINANAGAFDIVRAEIASGFDMTSSVGPLFPFPVVGTFPVSSGDSMIPGGSPSLVLEKTVSPDLTSYPVGSTVTYSIRVTNVGELPATNVSTTDELDGAWAPYTGVVTALDGGLLCVPPTCPRPRIAWPTVASLAGNSTQVITVRFQAVIPMTLADNLGILNTARAISAEQPAGVGSNMTSITTCAPAITLVKSLPVSSADYAVEEIIQWTIELQNAGGCDATGMVVTDTIDDTRLDESSISMTPSGVYDSGANRVTWTVGSVPAGSRETFQFSARILAMAQGEILCDTAIAAWDQRAAPLSSSPPGGACTAQPILPRRCQPALVVYKRLPVLPADYAEGEPIVWTVTMRNNGNCAASGVVLRDTIDTSLIGPPFSITPDTGSYNPATSTYTWPAMDVAENGTQVLTFTIGGTLLDGTEGSTACNTAIANLGGADIVSNPVTGSCTTQVILPGPRCEPQVEVDKTLPALPVDYAEGEPIEWTITVSNIGNCMAAGVALRDTIDTTLLGNPLEFTPDTGTYDPGTHTYTWPPEDIDGFGVEVGTFTVRGTVLDGTEGRFACDTAIANFSGQDVFSNPPTGTCTTLPVVHGPRCSPLVVLDKALPPMPADYAETEPITWTITLANTGNCTAAGVVVRDTVDPTLLGAPLVFTPPTGVWDGGSNTYTWFATDVDGFAGEVVTYTIGGTLLDGTEGRTACNTAVANFEGNDIISNPSSGTCTPSPIIHGPRCDAASIPAVTGLTVVKSGDDLVFAWTDPGAPEHHLNKVTSKGDIQNAWRDPAGVGVALCTDTAPGCTVLSGVLSSGSPIFFKALGACGPSGDMEGSL